MTTFLGILILVCALFLIIAVLLQSSKNHRMSGVISGGADTFFGKQKGKTIDALLSKATAIISIIFCILILALYIYTAKSTDKTQDNIGGEEAVAGDTVQNTDTTDATQEVADASGEEGADVAENTDATENADTAEDAEQTDVAE